MTYRSQTTQELSDTKVSATMSMMEPEAASEEMGVPNIIERLMLTRHAMLTHFPGIQLQPQQADDIAILCSTILRSRRVEQLTTCSVIKKGARIPLPWMTLQQCIPRMLLTTADSKL